MEATVGPLPPPLKLGFEAEVLTVGEPLTGIKAGGAVICVPTLP